MNFIVVVASSRLPFPFIMAAFLLVNSFNLLVSEHQLFQAMSSQL